MNNPTYRQERSGEFHANIVPRGNCGFVKGQQSFQYTAQITVSTLDEHGFIEDNGVVDRLICGLYNKGVWKASCEDLAGGCVCALIELMQDRAETITVEVRPNHYAKLSCRWERGQTPPTHVPMTCVEQELSHVS